VTAAQLRGHAAQLRNTVGGVGLDPPPIAGARSSGAAFRE